MALSEIEKLERRYAENPQGLTFAPLAEVHRKNGEVQRALELLKPGLALHPDYIPASIVLGRCHLDLGDAQAAEGAFLHVLALDGENVIALKALADISERLLRFEDAERWLQALLSVDRSNDEARAQLQRVETSRRQAEVGSSAEPSDGARPATVEAQPEAAEAPWASTGRDVGVAETPREGAFEPPVAEPAVGWVSQSSQATESSAPGALVPEPSAGDEPVEREPGDGVAELEVERPAGIQIEEPVLYDEAVEPLDGLVGREVDTPDEVPEEFRVESSEDIVLRSSGGNEFQVPDASQELFAEGRFGERVPLEHRGAHEDGGAHEAGGAHEDAKVAERWSSLAPEPVDGEPVDGMKAAGGPGSPWAPESSGADQSAVHAAPVWKSESAAASDSSTAPGAAPDSGEDFDLVDEFERPTAAHSSPGPEPEAMLGPDPAAADPTPSSEPVVQTVPPAERTPEAPGVAAHAPSAPKRSYAAGETGGLPVAQLLQGILSARPPAHSAAPPVRQGPIGGSGAPTRPAADALSLSSVFGEEVPAAPPAMPAASQGSGVRFDDFFASSGTPPASRTPRTSDSKNDDLDQFHAWLQNLKR